MSLIKKNSRTPRGSTAPPRGRPTVWKLPVYLMTVISVVLEHKQVQTGYGFDGSLAKAYLSRF
jgi:hypothetical protein